MIRLLLNLIYFCNLLSPTDSLRRWRLQFETFFFMVSNRMERIIIVRSSKRKNLQSSRQRVFPTTRNYDDTRHPGILFSCAIICFFLVQFSQRMFCCPGTKFVQSYELRLNKKCRSEHFSPTNFERVLLKVFEMTFLLRLF
jgi:hypothetical protein